jgi:hypothetical protein
MHRIVIINGHVDDISVLKAFYGHLFPECDIQFVAKGQAVTDPDPAFQNTAQDDIKTWEI